MPKPSSVALSIPFEQILHDVQAYDDFIQSHGVVFEHQKYLPCPIGDSDKDDIRSAHQDHDTCSFGFLYKPFGEVRCAFQGNTNSNRIDEVGLLDGSTVQVTLPRFYDCPKDTEVIVSNFDRFFLKNTEAKVCTVEKIERHSTGLDRLQYQALKVEFLIDSQGKEYHENSDFVLENGNIRWSKTRPDFNPVLGKGMIYSVRYLYRPFWYCSRILHEIRVANALDIDGNSTVKRMPYSIFLTREVVFDNQNSRSLDNLPGVSREISPPRSNLFGPR